jgi:hypothetical protein
MSREHHPPDADEEHGEHGFLPKGEARRKERGYHPVSPDDDAGTASDATQPDRTALGNPEATRPNRGR